jgi:hypothetical protein
MAAASDTLYETNFCAWTGRQAQELRRLKDLRLNVELDLDHVAEEIEDFGHLGARHLPQPSAADP